MPKISIIMPVYNKQDYLKRSLDSVLNQDFSDYELIVVDDGSKDESPKILDDYASKDPRIKVFHTENHGVSHARNTGLEKAEGDWIQFLDGDDQIDSEYLQRCQKTISEFDPDIIFTAFQKIDFSNNVLETVDVPLSGARTKTEVQKSFFDTQSLNGFYGFPSNKLFKKRLVQYGEPRFTEGLTLAEDLDFFVQLYQKIEAAYYLPVNSYRYLISGENYAGRKRIDYQAQLTIQKRIRNWTIDTGVYEQYRKIVDGSVCRYAAYAVFDAAQNENDIISICRALADDETVMSCLSTDYVDNKVHKRIVYDLQKNKIMKLSGYLKTRERIKKLLGRK